MKQFLFGFSFLLLSVSAITLQAQTAVSNDFRFFSQANLNYVFGINESTLNQKTNALLIKLVVGLANSRTGFGIGLENGSYRPSGGSGSSFETLNFSGNVHFLAKPITTDEVNYFVKGAAGYAPRLFRTYNKGFNYEIATGVLLTSKKKSKYFLQAIYHYQEFDSFLITGRKPKIKGVGLGVGTWF
ncbi:MAG TPA: hypothetical protein VFM79_01235 [Pelobium sp.]|nr:hypothetical protein [Pelobium sp.]